MSRLATPQEFQALESFVRRAHPHTIDQKKIVSAIIRRYIDDGFWDVEQAAHYAPEPDGDVIDSTAVLAHVLQEKMTVAAAKVFIRRSLRRLTSRRPTKVTRRPRGENRHNELLVRTAECLLAQEPPNESDLRLLIPLAKLRYEVGYEFLIQLQLTRGLAKSTPLRRELYRQELDGVASGSTAKQYREFRWCMQPDDIDWLVGQLPGLAEKKRGSLGSSSHHCFRAYDATVP